MNYTTVTELSKIVAMDKPNLYRLLKRLDINPKKKRVIEAGNQLVKVLNEKEVDKVKEHRHTYPVDNKKSVFYCIQIHPDIAPKRIKLGFTDNLNLRIRSFKTICPHLKLLKTWDCKQKWEPAIHAAAMREGDKFVSSEVFDVVSIKDVINRIDKICVLLH